MANEPTIVGGRYELGELLGRGGMADVRKAYDSRLGRTVAVKRLRTDLAGDATFQARFRREAQSAAQLNHPSIVAVYDTGEELDAEGSGSNLYIVMELVAGRTLRDVLREGRKILPERALEIVADVCAALDYSHRAGIVHRDIKPGNVMLTPAGDVKVMDFGIARAVADATSTMTQTAAVVGTAQYLSPEQARGENVDLRSDVYSTGCLLYELLTGRPPFQGENPVSVAYQHVRQAPAPPSQLEPDLPPEIDRIVLTALAKPQGERYQSAAAMKADIDRWLEGSPVLAAPVAAAPATTVLDDPAGQSTTMVAPAYAGSPQGRPGEKRRRGRGGLIALLLLLLGVIVAAVLILPNLLASPTTEPVPDLEGLTVQQAGQRLQAEGFRLGNRDPQPSEEVEQGLIISQDPGADDRAEPGTRIDVVVSSGLPDREVPSLINRSRSDAIAALESLDLEADPNVVTNNAPQGTVVAQSPDAGEEVAAGSTVSFDVSRGPRTVPSVVGQSQGQATEILERRNFTVFVVEETVTEGEDGIVLRQSPEGLSEASEGSQVTIVVSQLVEPTPEPTPTPTEEPTQQPDGQPTGEPSPTEQPQGAPLPGDERAPAASGSGSAGPPGRAPRPAPAEAGPSSAGPGGR
ncbi:Stk1 family PASTA domain-containing Ser/Thr kinase [Nocardioidaceae bacterium]|nr:Stk1 family PASTA domain-containing Ser/Thr kinase [Nocardioidaceae bacterium]